MTDDEIQRRIKALEAELENQRNGKQMHFTSSNAAILHNRIWELRQELSKPSARRSGKEMNE